MRNATRCLLSLFLVSALMPHGMAQAATGQVPTTTPKAATAATFVLEAGDVKIADLIDRAAAFLQWNILVNPQELANSGMGPGIFRLQQRVETNAQGCHELLASLLCANGFALTNLDEGKHLYEVVSMNGPRSREITSRAPHRSAEEVLARPELRMAVITVVQLQHINATIATNALRPFFASTGTPGGSSLTLGNVGNNTGMLLSGMQDQVANAIRMLRLVDTPPAVPPAQGLADQIEALQDRIAKLEKALEKMTEKK